MKDKFPEIYKKQISNLKSKVQKEFYYHSNDIPNDREKEINNEESLSIDDLRAKINSIFKRPDYIYKADVNIMYKNGKNINKKIVGFQNDYIITYEGDKIHISEIKDIK